MTRELSAYLDGVLTGTFSMTGAGALGFRYDEKYRLSSTATPMSMSMPLQRADHKNRVALPFLQGLLPDNAQALSAIGSTYGVSANSPFALLEHVGADVAGALQLLPPETPSPDASCTRITARAVSESEIGRMLNDAIEEYRDGKPISAREGRFSLAGAQPKIALHALADGGWGLPQDAVPTTHILKPVSGEMRGIDVIEQLTMGAARELGLVTAESTLAEFGGIRTFISTRYDRELRDGIWHRLHQEDLCQALAVSPAKKYQRRDGGPGLAAFAGLLDAMPLIGDRAKAARAFFEGFVFNAVIAGTDAHAKNYSIMLDGEHVRLAPLYDLASYAAYRVGDESIQLAMNVNGEYRLDHLSTTDFVRAATRLRIPGPEARDVVDRMRTGALGAFERARSGLTALGTDGEATADRLLAGIAGLPLVEKN